MPSAIRMPAGGSRGAVRPASVALLPWGDVFHDFLDRLGIGLDELRDGFVGSWMFGYAAALATAGVRTVIVCPTSKVDERLHTVHGPTGAELVFLPTGRLFGTLRGHALDGRLGGRRDLPSLARAAAAHMAPYAGTPPLALARAVRDSGCTAILCQEYETPRFDLCVGVGRILRVPVFATFQGGDTQHSRLERPLRPLAMRGAAGLVSGAARELDRVRAAYGVPEHKLSHVPNPVDVSLWRPMPREEARAAAGIPGDAEVVAWHGQVQLRRKGLDVLLDAWARVTAARPGRHLRLVLVGTGEDALEVRGRIAAGAPGVELREEWVQEPTRLRDLLSAADVYAFPSRHEGVPVAPAEAMACGLPVVGSDANGVPDVVGGCGIVAGREDARALADGLGALLDDPGRRHELGLQARRRAEEQFAHEVVGARLRAVLTGEPG